MGFSIDVNKSTSKNLESEMILSYRSREGDDHLRTTPQVSPHDTKYGVVNYLMLCHFSPAR